jgi:phage gpG-like protein
MIGLKATVDATNAMAKLATLPEKLRLGALAVVSAGSQNLLASVRHKLSGEALQAQTGRFRDSIDASAVGLEGRVASDGSVPYARILEMGGVAKVPEVFPVAGKALAFAYGGRLVFARQAAAHDVQIPARSYMRAALEEIAPAVIANIRDAVEGAIS